MGAYVFSPVGTTPAGLLEYTMSKTEHKLLPRYMRLKQIASYASLSESYLYALIAEGKFPRGQKIHPRLTVWSRETVDAALDKMMKGEAA